MNRHVFPARVWRMLPMLGFVAAAALIPVPTSAQSVERDLFVTVVDKSGVPVPNLGPHDLTIREDGRLREVLRMRRATDPIDLAILLDTSAAAGPHINDLRQGLQAFIARVREQSHIALIEYGERPRVLTDYTNAQAKLDQGIGRIFSIPGSGATVMEALSETLKGLAKRPAERAAILLVWLGGREFSTLDDKHVEKLLAEQRAALHVLTVSLGTPADIRTDEGRNREMLFDVGPRTSGGSRQNVITPMAIASALDKVATELLSQYRVTYARPDMLIPPETTVVSATNPALAARGTPARPVKTPAKSPAT